MSGKRAIAAAVSLAAPMPELTIRIKKKTDGTAALSCTRADGTATWQRQEGSSSAFFPLHDLTHYSVETVLGFRRAFYGLVADGWDLSSFEAPGARERIPAEALLAEVIVGFFDVERATGVVSSAEDFNWKIRTYFENAMLPAPAFVMTDEALRRIRSRRDELFAAWGALPAGETFALTFAGE